MPFLTKFTIDGSTHPIMMLIFPGAISLQNNPILMNGHMMKSGTILVLC